MHVNIVRCFIIIKCPAFVVCVVCACETADDEKTNWTVNGEWMDISGNESSCIGFYRLLLWFLLLILWLWRNHIIITLWLCLESTFLIIYPFFQLQTMMMKVPWINSKRDWRMFARRRFCISVCRYCNGFQSECCTKDSVLCHFFILSISLQNYCILFSTRLGIHHRTPSVTWWLASRSASRLYHKRLPIRALPVSRQR